VDATRLDATRCHKKWTDSCGFLTRPLISSQAIHAPNLQDADEGCKARSRIARMGYHSAHASRRLLTLRLKTCSLFTLFTTWIYKFTLKVLPSASWRFFSGLKML
jgi:hypothetical protein